MQSARSASIIFRSEERPGQFSFLFGKFLQIVLVGVPQNCIIETLNHTRVENEMAETDTTNNGFEKQIWDEP